MQGEYDIKVDPTVLPVQHGRRKVPIEYKEEIEKELAEMVRQGIIHQADRAHPVGQQSDIPQEGKRQAEDFPRPQGPKQGHHSLRTTRLQPSRR